MSKQFSIYLSIYNVLDRFYDLHPERAEELQDYLSEANPNIWEGECSGDPAVYEDFLEFLSKLDYESLSVYQIAKLYFAQLDEFYLGTIKIVAAIGEEEFNALLAETSK